MRRFSVVPLAGPDLHLYETVVFLGERNLARQVGVIHVNRTLRWRP